MVWKLIKLEGVQIGFAHIKYYVNIQVSEINYKNLRYKKCLALKETDHIKLGLVKILAF